MVSRKGDTSGEEILQKMNEITRSSAAHTDELVKSVGSLIAEQNAKLEAILKDVEDKINPEMESLQKTIDLVDRTTGKVDKVLADEAKLMEKELCGSGIGDVAKKKKTCISTITTTTNTTDEEYEEGESISLPSSTAKAVHFDMKSVGDDRNEEDV